MKNLICRAIREIKKKVPNISVICDIALDSYTLNGHDGIINKRGKIKNDQTIEILSKMAMNFSSNGCEIVAPSDMMDGRIKIIREV